MENIALLFPGQGSHHVGMGKELCEKYSIARQVFEEANDTLGFDLQKLCFEGSIMKLSGLENMFPALLAVSMAYFKVYMQEIGSVPILCAGHSLGEYSALTCAGALVYSDALKIVRLRGLLAQVLADTGACGMTIINGISTDIVNQKCKKISPDGQLVAVSCYNSPNQSTISGTQDAVMSVEDAAIEAGGTITPLIWSAPFHSPQMGDIADKLRLELQRYSYEAFKYPVISNTTALPYRSTEDITDGLTKQLVYPVRWQETMKYMEMHGVTCAIEMSGKRVLSDLVSANTEGIRAVCIGQEALEFGK